MCVKYDEKRKCPSGSSRLYRLAPKNAVEMFTILADRTAEPQLAELFRPSDSYSLSTLSQKSETVALFCDSVDRALVMMTAPQTLSWYYY